MLSRFLRSLCLLAVLGPASLAQPAPGAPGETPTWTNGNKQGIGTSITLESKVWLTLGDGGLTEVYYPTIDQANTRNLEFIVSDGRTFAEIESRDTEHKTEVPDTSALVFRQVNTSKSGRYRITKTYITDPARDTVLIQVRFEALKPGRMRLYVYYDPAIANSGMGDTGYRRGVALIASEGKVASALISSIPFRRTTSGFLGTSDGWTDIKSDFRLDQTYERAEDGNVVQVGELPAYATRGVPFVLALAFGPDADAARSNAMRSLQRGFPRTLRDYSQGWQRYLARLKKVDEPFQDQYQVSTMVLKAHEDKTWHGAGAASLSVPWGNRADASKPTVGGYHLVWSRDLYQVATAFMAAGDKESAERALDYLFTVQQKPDGSFPQNSWLDGRPYWTSLQLDELAYPLIMAYQLERTDRETYQKHVKPAAEFIVRNGPSTPQERWEEESGYSPSTIAAEIAGLICAAEIARRNQDEAAAARWVNTAAEWNSKLESWTVTTNGPHADHPYFVRITQTGEPDKGLPLELNNGVGTYDERSIVDAGFLELVRLGIRPPGERIIVDSLKVVDRLIRVETPNGPSWYRYNHDGYGEEPDGQGWTGTGGIGRLWILLTGERGEYEVAAGRDATPYLEAMRRMAGDSFMLSEQIWDRAEPQPFSFGEGTGSATPLAWTNAQFMRLAIAVKEGKLPETPAIVRQHFQPEPEPAAVP